MPSDSIRVASRREVISPDAGIACLNFVSVAMTILSLRKSYKYRECFMSSFLAQLSVASVKKINLYNR